MDDVTRLAVLREAVDRADALASTQARLIATQQEVIELQRHELTRLTSELAELKCAY